MTTPWESLPAPPLVIAEVGVNHNGDEALALELIAAAAAAGADIVKFQTYRTDLVVSAAAASAPYQQAQGGPADQAAMLRAFELSDDTWERLADASRAAGLGFMSTAFDHESLALVDRLDPVAHKVPSGEVTNTRFLVSLAALGRPVIVSTGMADTDEIATALDTLRPHVPVALLHCLTAYPAPLEETNLRSIPYLRDRFGVAVGWSDHTTETLSALAAVALDAVIVERHITLDRDMPGPDHRASSEPDEFAAYVTELRQVATALGRNDKRRAPSEEANVVAARRSWHATRDLAAGAVLTDGDITALRPEVGIHCNVDIVGRGLASAVAAGAPIHAADLADAEVPT